MSYEHTVILTGATGKLGMSLLENFQKNHYRTICLVRDLDKFHNLLGDKCNVQESKSNEIFQIDLVNQD